MVLPKLPLLTSCFSCFSRLQSVWVRSNNWKVAVNKQNFIFVILGYFFYCRLSCPACWTLKIRKFNYYYLRLFTTQNLAVFFYQTLARNFLWLYLAGQRKDPNQYNN